MRQRNYNQRFLFFLLGFSFSTYTTKNVKAQFPIFEATVSDEVDFHNIPSASGIVKFQNSYYIIGDDSPYLFQLDSTFKLVNKIKLFSTKKLNEGRLPKKDKPDFECITTVPWGNDYDLLVFGSGSAKNREVLVRIDIDQVKVSVEQYSLKKFYKHLIKKTKGDRELNIEGAGFWHNNLILLNRADNTLFKIDFDDFKEYIKDNDNDLPKIESFRFKLPTINGISARFSGVTVLPDEDIIVFTASVENDPNWMIEDNIVGSYLGIIDMNQLENNVPVCELLLKDDKPIKEKLESIYMIHKNEKSINLVGVVDNDNGSSKLLKIEFKKTFK